MQRVHSPLYDGAMNTKTVKGFSVSVNDVLAGAASLVGLLLSVFVGRAIGSTVLEHTGSVWLGTCAWIGVILMGAILFFGGIAYVLGASRTYRYPGSESASELENAR